MSDTKRIKKDGGLDAVFTRVKTPGTVDIGIIDAGAHQDDDGTSTATTAEIGYYNEFGLGVPERSFMRSTIHGSKKKVMAMQVKLLRKIMAGKITTEKALGTLGEFMQDEIQKKIISINEPPNADSTIMAKGTSNPLVATSQLVNSITYEVNR